MSIVVAQHAISTDVLPPPQARQLYNDLLDGWPSDQPFSADRVLEDHPELRSHKSVVIDLAFEEFTRRLESGEDVTPTDFAARFETVQKSLVELLQVNRFLHQCSLLPQSVEQIVWPHVGDRFLGFQLTGELGRGAFSRVYLAQDTDLGDRLVALKVCVGGGQEARVLGKLDHPQIVPVHSVQQDDESGLTGICMPFLSRCTLLDVLDDIHSGSLPRQAAAILKSIDEANFNSQGATASPNLGPSAETTPALRGSYVDAVVQMGIQLADALMFSHSKNTCHGDIKPSNVLLLPGGRAMLFDFNLSFDTEIDEQRVGGTLPYMAPEQLKALLGHETEVPADRDARSDLFSLGATLYELLTGRLPFGEIPTGQPRRKIARELLERREEGATPICELNPHVDPRLSNVIQRCLAFDPNSRWSSSDRLSKALRGHQSAWQRTRRWSVRHRRAILVAVSVLFITSSAFGAYAILREPAEIREARMGWVAMDNHEYSTAIAHFGRVLELSPEDLDARFAQGRAHMLAGNITQARTIFTTLFQQTNDPRITVSLAYCWAKERRFLNARQLFEQVQHAEGHGLNAVAVANNIGYCWLQQRRLDHAGEQFYTAVALAAKPNQVIQYNLAMLDFHIVLGQPFDWNTPNTQLIESAISLGSSSSAGIHFDAAAIYGLGAMRSLPPRSSGEVPNEDQLVQWRGMRARCIAAARKAVDLGLKPNRLARLDYFLRPPSKELEALKLRAEPEETPEQFNHFLDPLDGITGPVSLGTSW